MYSDEERKINIQCYADTLVYHEVNKNERNLVAMRYGGYPEHVRAMADIMKVYKENNINVPIRVDHVPLMAGESQELAGYTAVGRLYAIGYLKGIMEGVC